MNDNIAIKVENLSKYYRLGVINNGTLFRDIQSWMARKRGKEDPHAKLGSKYDSTAEGFWALKDLNFEIKKGDRVGIIGHNGAGKSTLLKLLSQITCPTEGNIKINGRIASLLEVGTGFHPELTGRENIFMNGAILGMTHAEIDSKVDQIIEFSEIGEHIDTPVKRYSSGMYVRLAFAVAAHLDSEILIADEVLAVGDAAFQKKALGKMNELSSGQGRTVLFVSHNMAQVKNLCNKGIVLNHGAIEKKGTIEECIDLYLIAGGVGNGKYVSIWENKNQISHPACNMESISIVNQHNELIEKIERNSQDKIYIKFIFEIQDLNSQLNIGFTLLNNSNDNVLVSWLRDKDENLNLRKGKNVLYVELPKELLNIGDYKIIFHAGLHHICYIIPPDMEIPLLSFAITGTLGVNFGDDTRRCIIAPIIEWKNNNN